MVFPTRHLPFPDVVLDQNEMDKNGENCSKVTVKNTGDAAGCEVVQLYIRDDYSDVVPSG